MLIICYLLTETGDDETRDERRESILVLTRDERLQQDDESN